MRKVTILTLMMVLVAGIAMADRATFDETKTQIALPMETPPVIDGIIEDGEWASAGGASGSNDSYWQIIYDEALDKLSDYKLGLDDDFVRGGTLDTGKGSYPLYDADMNIRIWAGYDSQYLYVAVRIVDDVIIGDDSAAAGSADSNTWEDDSVEVFVDGDNSNFDVRDTAGDKPEGWTMGGQYVITVANAYREAEAGNPGYGENAKWYALAGETANGYEAEFRMSLSLFGNPKAGDIVGFNIAVNDDDDGATLEAQYLWSGVTHVEAGYGNLLIGSRKYTAPKVTTAPVADGTISAGEYGSAPTIDINTYSGAYDIPSGDDGWALGDHDFKAWVVHDNNAVYVAVSAIDDIVTTNSAEAGSEDGSTWEDDSAEIFFDADNDDNIGAGTLGFEGQYVLTPNGAFRDNEANNPTFGTDWSGGGSTTADGYALEFKVMKSALSNPADGATLGFNVSVNDDDGLDRQAQLAWNGRAHYEMSYGDLILGTGGTDVADWSLY